MDVARKAVILARDCGLSVSLEDVAIDSLVPSALRDSSADDFMRGLPQVCNSSTSIWVGFHLTFHM